MLKLKPQLVKLNLCKGHLKRCRKKKKDVPLYIPRIDFFNYMNMSLFFFIIKI